MARIRCCNKIPFRLWIGVMLFLTTYINYLTRSNMSISVTAMVTTKKAGGHKPECLGDDSDKEQHKEEETGNTTTDANTTTVAPIIDDSHGTRYLWDETAQSVIIGSYFYGFFVGCIPSGFVAEWIGPYWVIVVTTVVSAILNSACVFVTDIHWGVLCACRILIGFMGAFVFPALHVLIARWAPPAEKGMFVSAMMGNTLGTCLCWALVGYLSANVNWYWGFHAITIQLVVFLIIFCLIASDYPDTNRWISQEEVEHIKTTQEGRVSKGKAVPPYLKMFASIPFWAVIIAQFGNLWGLYLQLTGVPKFLKEVVGFDLAKSGILGALPQLARLFLGLGFGALGDYLLKKEKMSKPLLRKSFIVFSHILPGVGLMLLAVTRCNAPAAVALLTVSMGLNGACVVTHLVNNQDLSPNFAGTIYSLHSLIGGTTGFICPAITSALIKDHNGISEWVINFIIAGTAYCIGGIVFIVFGKSEVQPWNEKKEKEAT